MPPKKKEPKKKEPKKNDSIYDLYFNYTKQYKNEYGDKTIVLMQVGSFYEMYGIQNQHGEITGSNVEDITNICNLNYSNKAKMGDDNIIMAGFPDYAIEKFLEIIIDNNYVVPLINQYKEGNCVNRRLENIYSKGTYIANVDTNNIERTNYIGCIWIHEYTSSVFTNIKQSRLVFGMSFVNILDGNSYIHEYSVEKIFNPNCVDELDRQLMLYLPKELIIISDLSQEEYAKILTYVNISNVLIHKFTTNENKEVINSSKIQYMRMMMETFFGNDIMNHCPEYNNNIIATQSLTYLLHYMQEHNSCLIKKIKPPVVSEKSNYVILGNHTVKQLNIINDDNGYGKCKSVLHFLNNTKTGCGYRLFKHQLMNPTTNIEWLNNEYEINLHFEEYYNTLDIRSSLKNFKDIELIMRNVLTSQSSPHMVYALYNSLKIALQHIKYYKLDNKLVEYFFEGNHDMEEKTAYIIHELESTFIVNNCQTNTISSIDDRIIQKGVNTELDNIIQDYDTNYMVFFEILNLLNTKVQEIEQSENEYFKTHDKDKTWKSIIITKRRSELVKTLFAGKDDDIFDYSNVKFINSTASNNEVQHPRLNTAISQVLSLRDIGLKTLKDTFSKLLLNFVEKYYDDIEIIVNFISKLDVLQCRIYNSIKYNYKLPTIGNNSKSFIDIKNMRHCLIEKINENELYVPNDIVLGKDDSDGILLYGTNAVGKTSLIRSIGICIILAQSGMYVPCSSMEYKPYDAIYSRIIGNDNLFKGLSTFAVEMSELRTILNGVNENTIVLGDELCSGTEMESAIGIFLSGLKYIHDSGSSHIFATHFHEIVNCDEMSEMKNTKCMHMTIHYDNELGELIYDRKLKEGSGPSCYGLEVCKSLYLNEEFLLNAYEIRKKYFPKTQGLLSYGKSHYNNSKIKGMCEKCGENIGEDIHHLTEQQCADDYGFIQSFHKNHKANLINLCKKCHDEIHNNNSVCNDRRKKTLSGKYII